MGRPQAAGDVFDKEGAVGEAAVEVRRRGRFRSTGGEEEVADVAVTVAEDEDGVEVWVCSVGCKRREDEAGKDGAHQYDLSCRHRETPFRLNTLAGICLVTTEERVFCGTEGNCRRVRVEV